MWSISWDEQSACLFMANEYKSNSLWKLALFECVCVWDLEDRQYGLEY